MGSSLRVIPLLLRWEAVVDAIHSILGLVAMASYDSLFNLLGESPRVETHSVFEEVVGICPAFVAVAVSAWPVCIVGNVLEGVYQLLLKASRGEHETSPIQEDGGVKPTISGDSHSD